ncbi:FecR family protein [Flavobacterium akiainvivens]|nr:FecR family protein [Flavobacterium akiainvivens]
MEEDVKLAKWLSGEMSGKELEEFMQTPEYATYSKIKEFSAQLTAPQMDMDSLYNKIQQNKHRTRNNEPKVRRLTAWLPRVAAILLLAFGAGYFLYTGQTSNHLADNGKRDTFLLPDNSEVVLNAGSAAEFKEWDWSNNRHIELKGEAYFKVAKGQKFDVVTPEGTVTVVGTQFNVKARNGRLDVTCYEGKVKVVSNGQEILLTPGKSVAYANGKNLDIANDKHQKPVWIGGNEVAFENESLEQVAAEIERQYNIKIKVDAQTARPYTGALPTNDIETALGIIKAHWTLNAANAGNNITLSAK